MLYQYCLFLVPLGILLLNENKIDEMCQILDSLHQYVPMTSKEVIYELPDGSNITTSDFDMWELLMAGDQLTAARIRAAVSNRANHPDSASRPYTYYRGLACKNDLIEGVYSK